MRPDLEQENAYYQKALKHPIIGQVGRDYLTSRGIKAETIEKWEIGWSPYGCIPPNFDKNDEYKPWVKLWGRIVFPIRDNNGVMISISGRLVLKNLNGPKYDHYTFPSRKVLFGLYQNKENIQKLDRVIITEGQLDVITAWQENLRIVTSSFGAHCSLDHFSLLSRYATKIDILYDEDDAGRKGTKAIEEFPTWGDLVVNLKTGIFPKGMDLDSWIKNHSADELINLIDKDENEVLKKRLMLLKNK